MEQFWIFGYGSLMWRPGFDYLRSEAALAHGYHRSLCVYSHVHRGTPDAPGLVLGLDKGGSCHGMGFEIAPRNWQDTIAYLRAREQVTSVYVEKQKTIRLIGSGRVVTAITYVVDRAHRQYAGVLSEQELLAYVRRGRGISGLCTDYVMNTVLHLRAMKIRDPRLEWLVANLDPQAASSSS